MPEFAASIAIFAPANQVFDYIRDITNLPAYTPIITRAEPQPLGNRVQVRGEANGRPFDVGGEWRVDRKAMRVEWSVDSNSEYGGSLGVSRVGQGSRVDGLLRFRVWTQEELAQTNERELQEIVQRDLERALHALKEQIEQRGRGSLPETPARTG